jgi:hypothetical protein
MFLHEEVSLEVLPLESHPLEADGAWNSCGSMKSLGTGRNFTNGPL